AAAHYRAADDKKPDTARVTASIYLQSGVFTYTLPDRSQQTNKTMPPKNTPTQQMYPKRHLLAASGIAALLCLTLLVYPSREVEAKKTFINIELEAQSLEEVTEPLEDSESIETQTLTSVAS